MDNRLGRWAQRLTLLILSSSALVTTGVQTADAQSFSPASFWGTRDFRIDISSTEEIRNRYNSGQYAANLSTHRRLLGNSRMYQAQIIPSSMNIRTVITNGSWDQLAAGWNDLGPSEARWGNSLRAFTVPPSWNGWAYRTMQSPGLKVAFTTNQTLASTGYNLRTLRVWGGNPQWGVDRIDLFERVTGVLVAGDDVVNLSIPATSDPMTVTVWGNRGSAPLGVAVWARCNAMPRRTAFHRQKYLNPTATIDLPACSGTWYIAVTNQNSADQVFNLKVSSHKTQREYRNIRVGVAYTISPAERRAVEQTLREAAWLLYGATQGTQLVKSFRWYQADACDDGWPAEEHACGGNSCHICLHATGSRSNCSASKKITLRRSDQRSAAVIAHEMGHCQLGLPDEYQDADQKFCQNGFSMGLCGYSIMEASWDNIKSLCTAQNHRSTVVDCRGSTMANNTCRGIPGPIGYECEGYRHWVDGTSAWDRLYNDGKIRYRHPNRSPDNYGYEHFARDTYLGNVY